MIDKTIEVERMEHVISVFGSFDQNLRIIETELGVKVLDMDFHAESRPEGNLYTNLYTLSMPAKMSYVDVIGTLSEHPNIRTVRTRNL